MTDAQSPLCVCAAWIVAGAMADGIDMWVGGETIHQHGPLLARQKWDATMRTHKVPLRVYLEREVYPVEYEP